MLELVENRTSPAQLKVIGVGGGGSNAVNRMVAAGLADVDFWVANTDMQALSHAACPNRLQIGSRTTRGRGAGGDPEMGRLSAEEDEDRIQEMIFGADMLFITAGMGGGTGTGAAPVIARIAKELGILTVGIVTKPFGFEGKKKLRRAMSGLDSLREHVDTLIAIPNEKLLHIIGNEVGFDSALLVADEVLFQATRGISDLITGHGIINLDFADVRTVMRQRGNALLGCGASSGPDRALEAAQAAVSSPLLEEVSIEGAQAVLINVQGGRNMTFQEAALAAQFITERAGDDADVFYGAVIDPDLTEEMRVTIIATGFPQQDVPLEEMRPVERRREEAIYLSSPLPLPTPTLEPSLSERMAERVADRVAERSDSRSTNFGLAAQSENELSEALARARASADRIHNREPRRGLESDREAPRPAPPEEWSSLARLRRAEPLREGGYEPPRESRIRLVEPPEQDSRWRNEAPRPNGGGEARARDPFDVPTFMRKPIN